MKRFSARIAALLALTVLTSPYPAMAFDISNGANDPNRPETWAQCSGPWNSIAHDIRPNVGGDNLCSSGCGQFSMTSIVRKSGKTPSDYSILDMRADALEVETARPGTLFRGDFRFPSRQMTGIKELSKGEIEWVKHVPNSQSGGWTPADLKREAWDKGYLAMFTVNIPGGGGCCGYYSHYVVMDYFDKDGMLHINDSGLQGTVFDQTYATVPYIGEVMLFKMADGTDVRDLPHLDGSTGLVGDGTQGRTSGSGSDGYGESGAEPNGAGVQFGILSESDLKGMEPLTEAERLQLEKVNSGGTKPGSNLFPQDHQFDVKQSSNVTDFVVGLQTEKRENTYAYLRSAIYFIPFLGMIYSVLFLMFYVLGYVSIFGSDKLFKLITFGRYGVRHDGSDQAYEDNRHTRLLVPLEAGMVTLAIMAVTYFVPKGFPYIVDFISRFL